MLLSPSQLEAPLRRICDGTPNMWSGSGSWETATLCLMWWDGLMTDRYASSCVVTAPVQAVWALISDPREHHRFDDTGMVGQPQQPTSLTGVGQLFTMNMSYDNGSTVEFYQSDNRIVDFALERCLAWATATRSGPQLGWLWRYDLLEVPGGTQVTLTYDWSSTSSENRTRFGVPLTDQAGLSRSLDLLRAALTTH